MPIDGAAFDPTTFTKNRERFAHVVRRAKLRRYVSSEHFSVDGTLLEAWASHKSLRPKEGPPTPVVSGGRNSGVDFRSQPRSNQTHSSTTDPEALLARKSDAAPAKLSYAGHGLMENRNALIVDMELTQADGRAEREPAAQMLSQASETQKATDRRRGQGLRHRRLRGLLRELGITAHLAQNTTNRRSAIDARTTAMPDIR